MLGWRPKIECPVTNTSSWVTINLTVFSIIKAEPCSDSAGIFKRLSDTAFLFCSRFFQPHFLIINIRAFVARGMFFDPHRAKFFCTLTLCRFFWQRERGRISSYFISCFLHNKPLDNAGTGTQSISCQNIRALLCRMIFLTLLTVNCQHVIREN